MNSDPFMNRQLKIILVDDDAMIQIVMPEFIKKALNSSFNAFDYEILTCENGKQGLDMYKQNLKMVKIIFTDFEMPELNGPGMTAEIRKLEAENKGNRVIIIGLTGNDSFHI